MCMFVLSRRSGKSGHSHLIQSLPPFLPLPPICLFHLVLLWSLPARRSTGPAWSSSAPPSPGSRTRATVGRPAPAGTSPDWGIECGCACVGGYIQSVGDIYVCVNVCARWVVDEKVGANGWVLNAECMHTEVHTRTHTGSQPTVPCYLLPRPEAVRLEERGRGQVDVLGGVPQVGRQAAEGLAGEEHVLVYCVGGGWGWGGGWFVCVLCLLYVYIHDIHIV